MHKGGRSCHAGAPTHAMHKSGYEFGLSVLSGDGEMS